MTSRVSRALRLVGAFWVLAVTAVGATLSATPARFLVPVALLGLMLWRSPGPSRWQRVRSTTAWVALWSFAAVASATIGVLYVPGLLALGLSRPWSDPRWGAPGRPMGDAVKAG